ncbi:hypothetical protein [Saliphagus sp. LR7]|uniref:hypothetical protein n=1 Tax=Saliphagus sp. LR7 TaxID=2282654 RepID=UPI0013007092|nr:hypothetical protein [Saliphagus sp. LR7]
MGRAPLERRELYYRSCRQEVPWLERHRIHIGGRDPSFGKVEEIFYMIKERRSVPTAQIASELERDHESVLNFRHDLQELCGELDDLVLLDVFEADGI